METFRRQDEAHQRAGEANDHNSQRDEDDAQSATGSAWSMP